MESTNNEITLEGDPDPKDLANILSKETRLLRLMNCRSNQWKEIFQQLALTNIVALQVPASRLNDKTAEELTQVTQLQ